MTIGKDHGAPPRRACPGNGRECAEVTARTITHHIKEPWTWRATAERYYFCSDPDCDVVYFGDDGSTVVKSELRTRVGVKGQSEDDLLCYCFGISKGALKRNPEIKSFVVAQTKAGLCSCDTRNPSGRCCLKDFPKDG